MFAYLGLMEVVPVFDKFGKIFFMLDFCWNSLRGVLIDHITSSQMTIQLNQHLPETVFTTTENSNLYERGFYAGLLYYAALVLAV